MKFLHLGLLAVLFLAGACGSKDKGFLKDEVVSDYLQTLKDQQGRYADGRRDLVGYPPFEEALKANGLTEAQAIGIIHGTESMPLGMGNSFLAALEGSMRADQTKAENSKKWIAELKANSTMLEQSDEAILDHIVTDTNRRMKNYKVDKSTLSNNLKLAGFTPRQLWIIMIGTKEKPAQGRGVEAVMSFAPEIKPGMVEGYKENFFPSPAARVAQIFTIKGLLPIIALAIGGFVMWRRLRKKPII